MPVFFDRGSQEAVCGGAEEVNPAAASHPWGEWRGMNRKRAERVRNPERFRSVQHAACAFLNSYFAFGTFVGI
jgi:hypothetical protein